ncbi:MBL fold metallo-hydrolase, partial [Hyalangium sp.]|uniref:MBL fold metallo-hydrolase n=1 Tax=Hyalangium sp. TaxID=2028555 RepID=UPI002D2FC057
AEQGKRPVGVFVSHCHDDHINGLTGLLGKYDIPVYAQREEVDFSEELRSKAGEALRAVGPGEAIPVGGGSFQALHTPGHTPGSQCLLAGGALVSGDTLFINGCGRCDLRGGSPEDMYRSLSQVLLQVPDETRLCPGHAYGEVPVAAMGEVRRSNPFFSFPDVKSFVEYRMSPRR